MISIIAATNNLNFIWKNNDLLYKIPKDLEYFKKITMDKSIVMGHKTFLSLPNWPLPGRKNIILSRNKNLKIPGCIIYNNIKQLIDWEKWNFIVIWGWEIYNLFLPYVKKSYITKINDSTIWDIRLQEYKNSFRLIDKSPEFNYNWLKYCFEIWER